MVILSLVRYIPIENRAMKFQSDTQSGIRDKRVTHLFFVNNPIKSVSSPISNTTIMVIMVIVGPSFIVR